VHVGAGAVGLQERAEALLGPRLVAVGRDRDAVRADEGLDDPHDLAAQGLDEPPRIARRRRHAASGARARSASPNTTPCVSAKERSTRRSKPGGIVCGDVTLYAATQAPRSSALARGRSRREAGRGPGAANGRPRARPVRTPPSKASPAPAVDAMGTSSAGTLVQLPSLKA